MDEPYISPLPDETLVAVAKLVTAWGATETILPMQVARLVATSPVQKDGARVWEFDQAGFLKACVSLAGTDAKAALAQIKHLTSGGERSREIEKAADRLRAVKVRRDEFCHWLVMPHAKGGVELTMLSASRSKVWQEKHYTIDQLTGWTSTIKQCDRVIDAAISEVTGWTWARIQEAEPRWRVIPFRPDA